ncbi:hypothetical protein [Halalkalibacillus halophilus]|uniref:hypothetical protein n=1 Tax=Halalkalibacillus halophilus TaxID=392827 RepID=UPI00041E91D8|nr:hypothetical protein [Halalkalibacillus halophilus]
MLTSYDALIKEDLIGSFQKFDLGEIQELSQAEMPNFSWEDQDRTLFLGIDLQNDFMESGALGVPGSHEDMKRTLQFIYHNFNRISQIMVSLDTHSLQQVFHPTWWVDRDGNHPAPLTIIRSKDIDAGSWRPVMAEEMTRDYVKGLEEHGNKDLCIWPFHCIEGTPGAALESQFSRMVHFHTFVSGSPISKVVKGKDPYSEKYGIVEPEYSQDDLTDYALLSHLEKFDRIVIAGQAESHCVYESVRQICEYFYDRPEITKNIFVLKDCMSCIPGFEEETEKNWDRLKQYFHINLVHSKEFSL